MGFDPTAPSLHHGHLVQVLTARRLQQAGHRPLALVGGSTGLIGDPRPTSERTLNTKETVASWVETIRAQIEPFLSFEGDNAAVMVNNLDWTAPMSAIDFLRDVGKHFRVNKMITKDAVAARLNSEQGISYTEFSYQLLQGLDFLELLPSARLHAAVRRQRPVGQPDRRTGPDPPGRACAGARLRDAVAHARRRNQVRRQRGRGPVARPGAHLAVRLLPVLAQQPTTGTS